MIVAAIGCGGSLPWGVRFFNRFSFRSKSQYDGREARGHEARGKTFFLVAPSLWPRASRPSLAVAADAS